MRFEIVSSLAGGIAHDIKQSAYGGIQGNVSLMYTNTNPDHENYKRLQNIEKNIKLGAEITTKTSGFAQGGKYMFRPILEFFIFSINNFYIYLFPAPF
ncbi:MAG: hypothetical protein DRH24_13750 [Deltaproteobacteria bacterium]|nr:MAG: hypothetical protein DRH24_13750 [Deltaproteobacteria bacterium]